ncbi:MAG: hypothetical protein IPK88_07720 [Saprospiraceae bacterium]|nr:hypothetical protein [Candidatus Defluviibacterium haderslevense]
MTNIEYFNLYGGTALGLKLAYEISTQIPNLNIPAYDLFEVETLKIKNFDLLNIQNTLNKTVLFKFSGTNEDFSPRAARGINSSRSNPIFIVNKNDFNELVFRNESLMNSSKIYKAIIIQELITQGNFYISQIIDGSLAIELNYKKSKVLIISNNENSSPIFESNGSKKVLHEFLCEINVQELIKQLWQITFKFEFESNVEGFINSVNKNIIVQLRPTPNDIKKMSIPSINEINADYQTYFNFGSFEIEGLVYDINDKLLDKTENDCLVLLNEEKIPFELKKYHNLTNFKKVVFLHRQNCFKLSHSPTDLPPFGKARDKYNYIYVGDFMKENIIGKKFRALCDGNIAKLINIE